MARINLYEVGPRDGLQNEPDPIPLSDKVALVDLLSSSGLTHIECASFVSPKWVPQMANSAEVLGAITRNKGVSYAALVPNAKGLDAALSARADEVAVFASASEGFSQANINASVAESLERFRPVLATATAEGLPVRGYVSCVIACPFDGATSPEQVLKVSQALLDMGCREVSLGDTIGAGTPETVDRLMTCLLEHIPANRLAGHFHDTGGQALDNIDRALAHGITTFDTAVGGLGGCPYAPGAPGNVATEAVARHLIAKGHDVGLDMVVIDKAAEMARRMRGRTDV